MTEMELRETLSRNIKKYRKGKFTQEQLAAEIGVSTQNINDIEGKRRWSRESTLVKIADALNIEVYRLFVDDDLSDIETVEGNSESERIRAHIQSQLISDFRKTVNRMLDKWEPAVDD
ncbi:MAG: helix-turn-helix transcriptional regulator [Treponema sp.]|nr:helix-turn-helix transcriptional regulator [Treponema sp.]